MSQKSCQKTPWAMDIHPVSTVDDVIDDVEDGDRIDFVEFSDPGDVYDAGHVSN